jgi:1-aminocyclopropane-1-carboxylate deaminase/D-cysteine desulfhydrase-like pyridoxal-dependent ACC family enzyme
MPFSIVKTPVIALEAVTPGGRTVWVKRDDLSHPLYGGNKPRKLIGILAEARRRGMRRIVTLGATGSHHVLATTLFAKEEGIAVAAIVIPQPVTPHVQEILRCSLSQGATLIPARSIGHAMALLPRVLRKGDLFVPPGGSSFSGARAYIDAALEIEEAVGRGEIPVPDRIVVAAGSGGTAAGIAAGVARLGWPTRVVAVAVAGSLSASLVTRVLALGIGRSLAAPRRLSVDGRYLGGGYGHVTAEGEQAAAVARRHALSTDPTYTAKAFAAALDLADARPDENVLYWHTLSSAPVAPLLTGATDMSGWPTELRSVLGAAT